MLLRSLGTLVLDPAFRGARRTRDVRRRFFDGFLSIMAREAAAAGVSWSVLDGAFAGLMPDGAAIARDRRQRGTFRKSFADTPRPASSRLASNASNS
jgi:membrane-bound lytic murein transglycosylase B